MPGVLSRKYTIQKNITKDNKRNTQKNNTYLELMRYGIHKVIEKNPGHLFKTPNKHNLQKGVYTTNRFVVLMTNPDDKKYKHIDNIKDCFAEVKTGILRTKSIQYSAPIIDDRTTSYYRENCIKDFEQLIADNRIQVYIICRLKNKGKECGSFIFLGKFKVSKFEENILHLDPNNESELTL